MSAIFKNFCHCTKWRQTWIFTFSQFFIITKMHQQIPTRSSDKHVCWWSTSLSTFLCNFYTRHGNIFKTKVSSCNCLPAGLARHTTA
jgi:hypothetical protein